MALKKRMFRNQERRLLLAVALLSLVVGIGAISWAQSSAPAELQLPGGASQLGEPMRRPDGSILLAQAKGAKVTLMTVRLVDRALAEADVYQAPGEVVDLELAPSNGRGNELVVVASCPAGFGAQNPADEFRQCIGPIHLESFEITPGATLIRRQPLPQGLGQGTLLGSNQLFVWESFDPMGLAVYKSGQWESLPPNLLDSRPIVERCASRQELWVLNGDFGPASLTGSDNAVPNPSPRFFLYRLPLKESDPGWESVPVLGLEESSFAELACSETEAFVRVDSSLFFTRRPRTPIAEAEGLEHLRGNPALRPVVFLQDFESCAVVMPGGRIQRTNRGRPGTATSPTTSVCDAVPWPTDRGHSAISLGVRGMLQEQPW